MKKIKYIVLVFIFGFVFTLASCSVNTITKISDEVEYTKIESDITTTYDEAKKGCIAIVARNDSGAFSGSGVIFKYDSDTQTYYVVTNHHVIEGATSAYVYFNENKYNAASIVGSDSTNDIAVLTFQLDAFNSSLASSLKVHDIFNYENDMYSIGQTVLAIGCPLTLSNYNQLSTGVLSNYTSLQLTVDCALNPGNSGGGLFNLAGRLIGIVNSKKSYVAYSTSTIPAEGLGYAIPLALVKSSITDILATNKVITRPTLGITVSTVNSVVNPSLYEQYKVYFPNDGSYVHFLVVDLTDTSKAKASGMLQYDVILKINGKDVTTADDITYALRTTLTGDVTLTVYRALDGYNNTLDITVTYE